MSEQTNSRATMRSSLAAAFLVAANGGGRAACEAFTPPRPIRPYHLINPSATSAAVTSVASPAVVGNRGGLQYIRHEDEMGWIDLRRYVDDRQQEQQSRQSRAPNNIRTEHAPTRQSRTRGAGGDYEDRVDARFSRHRRRERLRRMSATTTMGRLASDPSYGSILDRQRVQWEEDGIDFLGEQSHHHAPSDSDDRRRRRRPSPPPPDLLSNTPIPVVNFRVNSDFPASELPASEWMSVASVPAQFEMAEYSDCVRADGVHVLVPCDDDDVPEGGHALELDGGGKYVVRILDDVLVPRAQHHHQPHHHRQHPASAYWVQDKIYDAIYGQVRYGTVLHGLSSPVEVQVSPPSSSKGGGVGGGAEEHWVTVDYVLNSLDPSTTGVAVKEMTWEALNTKRMELAEDPIKEVAAMQYLQRWVEDDAERERYYGDVEGGGEHHHRSGGNAMDRSHIMMPLDLLSDDDNLYSITPWCEGGRLLDIVESKVKFSEPEARYWMRQILTGLSCLKKAGVCHRDMSPENLMVHDGKLYIIDLGMCLKIPYPDDGYPMNGDIRQPHQRSLIVPHAPCGKWYYLSPEVALSEQPFDGPTVDLWAAGVILFVMLTGQPPWEEPKMTDDNFKLMSTGHLEQILDERRVGLSSDAMDLLQRMFWLDPADRLSLEQVCSHPWITHMDAFGFQ